MDIYFFSVDKVNINKKTSIISSVCVFFQSSVGCFANSVRSWLLRRKNLIFVFHQHFADYYFTSAESYFIGATMNSNNYQRSDKKWDLCTQLSPNISSEFISMWEKCKPKRCAMTLERFICKIMKFPYTANKMEDINKYQENTFCGQTNAIKSSPEHGANDQVVCVQLHFAPYTNECFAVIALNIFPTWWINLPFFFGFIAKIN